MKKTGKHIAMAVSAAMMHIAGSFVFATGTSSAQFLKLGAGARATAMGDAFSSVANDATATYWNPAGLAQLETPEITAMQNTHFVDTQYQYLGGAMPVMGSVLGVSLYRLDYGTIDRYTNADVKDGSFDAGSLAASVSLGRKFTDRLMLGASLKFISESIESEKASSFAADLGGIYKLDRYHLSAVLQHMGPGMKMVNDSAPLPMTVRVGASTRLLEERLLVSLEVSKPNDANISLHAGTEYRVVPLLALRGGYRVTPGQSADLGGLTGLSAGLGAQFNRFNLDYSVSPFGDLGISHRFTLGVKFGTAQ